jgi:hypothetical protein
MYQATIPQFIKMLGNLTPMLDKAVKHAETKKYDVSVLLSSRLAPDQYPFIRQIQIACDTAKGFAARMSGQEPPKHEDNEKTLDEVRHRIHKTVQYLQTIKAEQFKDSEKRPIRLSFMEGKAMTGFDYATEMAIPNFYFHVTTAYAILRHNGIDVGKMDFLGQLKFHAM